MSGRLKAARKLQEYLERYGAQISRQIEVFENAQGKLSLRATSPIRSLDVVASIPDHLCLIDPSRYVPQSSTFKPDAHIALAHRLMEESRNIDSPHKLHISTLPDDMSTFPRVWTGETWDLFKGSTLHHMFDRILKEQRGNSELMQWAHNVVSSRSFGMGGSLALVPFLDFVGHDSKMCVEPIGSRGFVVLRGESTFNKGMLSYNLVALADHPPGAELLQCLGDLTFEDKLMGYGWLDTDTSLTDYAYVNLALPFTLPRRYYGKKPVQTMVCPFNMQEKRLGPSVSSFLTDNGISKRTLLNAVRRRHRDVQDMLSQWQADRGARTSSRHVKDDKGGNINGKRNLPPPSASTALMVVSDPPLSPPTDVRGTWPGLVLQHEAKAVSTLLSFLEEDSLEGMGGAGGGGGYSSYMSREKELLEELAEIDDREGKNASAYALLLYEQTGLDVLQEVGLGVDGDSEDESEDNSGGDDPVKGEEGGVLDVNTNGSTERVHDGRSGRSS